MKTPWVSMPPTTLWWTRAGDADVGEAALAARPADGDAVVAEAGDVDVVDADEGELDVAGQVVVEQYPAAAGGALARPDEIQIGDEQARRVDGGQSVAGPRIDRRAGFAGVVAGVAADDNERAGAAGVVGAEGEVAGERRARLEQHPVAACEAEGVNAIDRPPGGLRGEAVVGVAPVGVDVVGRQQAPSLQHFDDHPATALHLCRTSPFGIP